MANLRKNTMQMDTMKSKLRIFCIPFLMIFSLTSCNDNKGDAGQNNTTSVTMELVDITADTTFHTTTEITEKKQKTSMSSSETAIATTTATTAKGTEAAVENTISTTNTMVTESSGTVDPELWKDKNGDIMLPEV